MKNDLLPILEGASCYVGETFRKNLNGYWWVHLAEPNYPFGRLPVIEKFDDRGSTLCPCDLTLIAIDKRIGGYLYSVLTTWMQYPKSKDATNT
jgi:hypothetical protein